MNKQLKEQLDDMYEFGKSHDSKAKAHSEQLLNITPDTGLFLSILVQAVNARQVLEIGTSDGYSTIWIADALRSLRGGTVTTFEISEKKFRMAKLSFEKSGLTRYINHRLGDIRPYLRKAKAESVDLIFLDAERPQYVSYWVDMDRALKPKGLLVVDNALSPKPEELVDFFNLVQGTGRYLSQMLQIGKGEMVALKQQSARPRAKNAHAA